MSTDYEMAWQDAHDYCRDVAENSALVEILSVEVILNYFSVDCSSTFYISGNGLPWYTTKNLGDSGKYLLLLFQ